MYKMSQNHPGMIGPPDDYVVPHSIFGLSDVMGRGHMERESFAMSQKRPMPSPSEPVREVKKSRSKSLQYVCSVATCREKFASNKQLNTHVKLHLGVKPFTCDLCGKVCQTESKLKAHQSSHANDGVKPICDICERSFSSQSSLNKHKKMLHKPKPHVCPQCHSGFEEHKYMAIHAKRAHNLDIPLEVENNTDTCLSCTIDFNGGNGFTSNDSSENSSKDLFKESCPVPVNSFSMPVNTPPINLDSLPKKSTLTSISELPVSSKKEDAAFNSASPLINCTMCTSTFPSLAYLEQHMAVHANEKGFTCISCTSHFSTQDDLMNHMKMHKTRNTNQFMPSFMQTGIKSPQECDKYICVVCKENFVNLNSLKSHQAQEHDAAELHI